MIIIIILKTPQAKDVIRSRVIKNAGAKHRLGEALEGRELKGGKV